MPVHPIYLYIFKPRIMFPWGFILPEDFHFFLILSSFSSSQIYPHALQRCLSFDPLCFFFFKTHGILHKFQMRQVLERREIYFPFNFVTLLTYFSFLFFQDMNLPIYFSLFWLGTLGGPLWFAGLMPSTRAAFHLFRYIYWAPYFVTNCFNLIFHCFNSTSLLLKVRSYSREKGE